VSLPLPGQRFADFDILAELGRGGMGAVFHARRGAQDFALKVILADDAESRARFEREARAVAVVGKLPGVVRVHSYHADGPLPYITFDLIEGESLDKVLAREGRFPPDEALALVAELAGTLEGVHAQGVVHRDIKPANVLVRRRDGALLLTDFGLARPKDALTLTQSQELLGTPHYMAPEQAASEHQRVGPRSDVWALGIILYELLIGERPFQGQGLFPICNAIMRRPVPPPREQRPELSPAIEQVILRALEKDPLLRYQSAADFAEDCRRARAGEALLAEREGLAALLKRRWRALAAPMRVGLLLAAFLVMLSGQELINAVRAGRRSDAESREAGAREARTREISRKLTEVVKADWKRLPEHLQGHLESAVPAGRLDSAACPKTAPLAKLRSLYLEAGAPDKKLAAVAALLCSLEGGPEFSGELPKLPGLKARMSLIRGYRRLRSAKTVKGFRLAAKSFREGSGGATKSVAAFGQTLALAEARDWAGAVDSARDIEEVKRIPGLAELIARVGAEGALDQIIQSLARECSLKELNSGLPSYARGVLKATEGCGARALERALVLRVRALDRARKDGLSLRLWASFEQARRERPGLPSPKLSSACLRRLVPVVEPDLPISIRLQRALRQQDQSYVTPERFRSESLNERLNGLTYFEGRLDSICQVLLAASESGVHITVPLDARRTLQDRGVFAEALRADPLNPYIWYWQAVTPQDRSTPAANRRFRVQELKLLDQVLGSSRTNPTFRALALVKRAKKWREMLLSSGAKPAPGRAERSWRDLELADTLPHPSPDRISREFTLLAGYMEKPEAVLLAHGEEFFSRLAERNRLTIAGELSKGRPYSLTPLSLEDSYKEEAWMCMVLAKHFAGRPGRSSDVLEWASRGFKVGTTHLVHVNVVDRCAYRLSQTYQKRGELKKAEEALRKALARLPSRRKVYASNWARRELAGLHIAAGRLDAALALLDFGHGSLAAPNRPLFIMRRELAAALLKAKRPAEALVVLAPLGLAAAGSPVAKLRAEAQAQGNPK